MHVESLEGVDESVRKVADVMVEGLNGFSIELEDTVYGNIVTSEKVELPSASNISEYGHCAGIEFVDFSEELVVHQGVITGSKYAWTWSKGKRRVGGNDQPIAVHSSLGWGPLGPKKVEVKKGV